MRRNTLGVRHLCAVSVLSATIGLANQAFAWGSKGHQTVNMAAVSLCRSPIKDLLSANVARVGDIGVVPDSQWKKPETLKQERPMHFFQWDNYRESAIVDRLPMAYNDATQLLGKSFMDINGTAVWRAESLYRELVTNLKAQKWVEAIQMASVMGHYVADMSQPMHASSDYDGQSINRRGIHSGFETALLNGENRDDLVREVADLATEAGVQDSTNQNVVAALRVISLTADEARDSLDALPAILDLYRDRNPDEVALLELAKKHMARGAATLAIIWDMAAKEAGLTPQSVPHNKLDVPNPTWRPIR